MAQQLMRFKGDRRYVHGTDIYELMNSYAAELAGVGASLTKLVFRNPSEKQLEITEKHPIGNDFVCEVHYELNQKRIKYWLIPSSDVITERVEYPEDSIATRVKIEDASGILESTDLANEPYHFTTIEKVIAVTKTLNNKLAKPQHGKWLFGQLELTRTLPITSNIIEVTCDRMFTGRFSLNSICIDGNACGVVRFIVGDSDAWN